MRRHLAIATLVSMLVAAPMWAQVRSARGGVSIGRQPFVSHGPVMVNRGSRIPSRGAFIGRPRGMRFGGSFHGRFFDRDRFLVDRFHRRQLFFFASYPFSGFYPWVGASPADYEDYSNLEGPSSYQGGYDSVNASAQSEMASAIARLSDQVQQLREERASREALPPKSEPEQISELPESTVLVFRDKHTQDTKNYAIVGWTLWILDEQQATKIPLSSLDIDATIRLNEQRGIEFSLPQ